MGGSFQAGANVVQGREALFRGDYQGALGHFQQAEQTDPNYIYGMNLEEGVLSYLGRAQYLTGNLAQARQTLEQSLAQHSGNNLARLYLGLTLARQGDHKGGQQQIEAGMKGMAAFINNITQDNTVDVGKYWDPSHAIRKAIANNLGIMARGNFDWPTVIANGESIAMDMEHEPDLARRDRDMDRRMNSPF